MRIVVKYMDALILDLDAQLQNGIVWMENQVTVEFLAKREWCW